MVARVPGFTIQDDSGGERGLGQADLNILSGRWEYAARFEDRTEPQLLEGELSVSGTRGNVEFVASLDIGQFTFSELGTEQFFNGSGVLTEDRSEDIFYATERPSADLNLTFTPDNGHVAHLNLSTQLQNLRNGVRETFIAVTPEGNTGSSFADGGEDEFEFEIGGDYAFPLAGGNLKLIALHSYEDSEFDNSFQIIPQMGAQFRSDFDRFDKEAEFIGRAEYSWKPQNGVGDWQLSWEGAFNYLDSTTELSNTFTDLTDEIANTGNSQIVPTQFWTGEVELERKGGGAISGTAKVYARFIEDPIDRILFPDGSEGPGNLDSAWQYGVQGTLNWFYDINLTHDFENSPWAYGIGIEQADQSTFFRRDQSFRTRFVGPENVVRLTHKDVFGVRLDVFLQNFVPFKTQRERLIFDGDRLGDLVRRETYSRQRGRRMGFKISDTF